MEIPLLYDVDNSPQWDTLKWGHYHGYAFMVSTEPCAQYNMSTPQYLPEG